MRRTRQGTAFNVAGLENLRVEKNILKGETAGGTTYELEID